MQRQHDLVNFVSHGAISDIMSKKAENSADPGNENITENRRKFRMVQPEEFHAGLRAQCFDQPRHRIQEAIHQNQPSFFLRIKFVGRQQPTAWKEGVVEGEIIKCWVHSVLDYESAADIFDAVAQHREVGI